MGAGERAREEDPRRIGRRGPTFRGLDSHHGVSFPRMHRMHWSRLLPCPVELLKPEGYLLSSSVLLPPQSAFQQVLSSLLLKHLNASSSSLHSLSLTGS